MSLNNYRDEAEEFLKGIGEENQGTDMKINMLQEEFSILKEVKSNPDKLRHQIYDMLFILFEMAADYEFDLDEEWSKGRKSKKEKYLSD